MVEVGCEWGRIERAQAAVEAKMIEVQRRRGFESLRHIGLKNVATKNPLDDFANHPLIAYPREIAGPASKLRIARRGRHWGTPEPRLKPAPALDRAPAARRPLHLGKTS